MKTEYRVAIIILGLIVLAVGVLRRAQDLGPVEMIVCDVGQGSGLIVKKGNVELVYDVGPENGKMAECLGKYLWPWDKKLEIVIISHWDVDHSGGLVGLSKYYQIEQLWSGQRSIKADEQINYTGDLRQGDVIKMGEIVFDVYWPKEIRGVDNDDSVMGVISYNGKKIMVTGDISRATEDELIWRKELTQTAEVLVVAHHGSAESTSEEWLEVVGPKLAIISVGKNKYGHPGEEVLKRLEMAGVEIKRTDRQGSIVLKL